MEGEKKFLVLNSISENKKNRFKLYVCGEETTVFLFKTEQRFNAHTHTPTPHVTLSWWNNGDNNNLWHQCLYLNMWKMSSLFKYFIWRRNEDYSVLYSCEVYCSVNRHVLHHSDGMGKLRVGGRIRPVWLFHLALQWLHFTNRLRKKRPKAF